MSIYDHTVFNELFTDKFIFAARETGRGFTGEDSRLAKHQRGCTNGKNPLALIVEIADDLFYISRGLQVLDTNATTRQKDGAKLCGIGPRKSKVRLDFKAARPNHFGLAGNACKSDLKARPLQVVKRGHKLCFFETISHQE